MERSTVFLLGAVAFAVISVSVMLIQAGTINPISAVSQAFRVPAMIDVDQSGTVQWTVEDTVLQEPLQRIQATLSSPGGWQDAGLTFVETGRLEDVSIIFRVSSVEDMPGACGKSSATGCASMKFVDDRVQCTVDIQDKYITGDSITSLVNHEVGHCLGLGHSDDPDHVMRFGEMNVLWPHSNEVAVVRNVLWPDGKE